MYPSTASPLASPAAIAATMASLGTNALAVELELALQQAVILASLQIA